MGKQQHTKYSRHPTPLTVTVTRRYHPLVGKTYEVTGGGPTFIVIRLGDATPMRLPRAWTDADGPPAGPASESLFSVAALRELTALVAALGRRAGEPHQPAGEQEP